MTSTKLLSDPPERTHLGLVQMDDLGLALMTLMRELWVVIDRQAVTEKLLERHGISSAEIDAYQPDAAFAAALDARRKTLIDAVMSAMGGKPAA
jgi:hypothetical protein